MSTVEFSNTTSSRINLPRRAGRDAGCQFPRIYRFSHDVGRAELKREHLADQVLTATDHDECRTGVAAVAPQQFQTRFAVGVEAGKRHVHSASRQEPAGSGALINSGPCPESTATNAVSYTNPVGTIVETRCHCVHASQSSKTSRI